VLSGFVVMLQSLAHTYYVINRVSKAAIELNDAMIVSPNQQVDFGAATIAQQPLSPGNNGARETASLILRGNGEIIEPASMALIAGHDTGHNLAIQNANQKQIRPDAQFASDVFPGVVPRANQIATLPQRDYCLLVLWLERSNLHERAATPENESCRVGSKEGRGRW
jgi:hypothetical protein